MLKIDSKNILRIILIGLGILLVIIALVMAGSKVASQDKSTGNTPVPGIIADQALEENFKIVYILNKGEGQETLKFDYILHKGEKQTVFDILKDLSKTKNFKLEYNYNFPKLGVLIDSIDGVKSGTGGKWWQYWVNDKLGEVAADKKEINAGDKVEWRFEKIPEF